MSNLPTAWWQRKPSCYQQPWERMGYWYKPLKGAGTRQRKRDRGERQEGGKAEVSKGRDKKGREYERQWQRGSGWETDGGRREKPKPSKGKKEKEKGRSMKERLGLVTGKRSIEEEDQQRELIPVYRPMGAEPIA